jgi:hypothetical protein
MMEKIKMPTYLDLHSKEYFMKTREKFIRELKETGELSEDDLKMIEEVWGRQRIV